MYPCVCNVCFAQYIHARHAVTKTIVKKRCLAINTHEVTSYFVIFCNFGFNFRYSTNDYLATKNTYNNIPTTVTLNQNQPSDRMQI